MAMIGVGDEHDNDYAIAWNNGFEQGKKIAVDMARREERQKIAKLMTMDDFEGLDIPRWILSGDVYKALLRGELPEEV